MPYAAEEPKVVYANRSYNLVDKVQDNQVIFST